MSLEKLAHDSYTQGFTETLRNMEIPDHIKVAAYKEASANMAAGLAALGGVTGALDANRGDVAEGAAAGVANVASKGIKGGLGGAALLGALQLATRGRSGHSMGEVLRAGGQLGAGAGASVGALQNLTGWNPHYEGHDSDRSLSNIILPSPFGLDRLQVMTGAKSFGDMVTEDMLGLED